MSTLPYMAHIKPSDVPSASSGTWTLTTYSAGLGGQYIISNDVQGNYREYSVPLAVGTYRLTIIYSQGPTRGIGTLKVNGTTVGTADMYSGGMSNVVTQVSGIALTAGNHLVRVAMDSKNASSSGYVGLIQHISLLRTGD